MKRKAEESVSKSGSSEEEEEDYLISLSSNDEEYQESATPSQSDPVDEPETPPFKMNPSTTRSKPEISTACSKRKAT